MNTYGSSEELAAALARGENLAFETFALEYGPRLRAYLLAKGLNASEAEALAVSLVTDIALKAPRFRLERGGSFDAWVFTLARNGVADWYRNRARTVGSTDYVQAIREGTVTEPTANVELIDAVREAFARIDEVDQEILRRRDMGYMQPYEEIAAELKMRPGTARLRRLRALRKLQGLLRSDERIKRFLAAWVKANPESPDE